MSAEISTFLDEWHRYEEIFKKMLEINDQQQSGDHSRPAAGGRMSFGMVGRLSIQHTSSLWKKASSSLVKQQTTKETKESLASALENASTFKVLSTNIAALVTKADSILLKVDALQHVPRSEELEQVSLKMKADQNLLHSVVKLQESLLEWNKSPIATLNPEELQSTTDELLRVINDSDIVMIRQIKRGVNNFLSLQFKIIQLLKYDQFKPWHWERIRDILQYSPFTIESHSVMDVLSKNVKTLNLIDLLKEIQDTAINELRLQKTLNTIHSRLGSLEIELEDFVDSGLVIIKSYDHLINIIEGDILAVGMLDLYSDSHYHDQVKTLESRLALALNYLKEWDQMQPLMVKCFSFFDTEEAKARLVSEMRRFKALQRAYNVLIKNIQNNDQLGALIDEYPEIVSAVINIKEGLGKLFTDIQGWVDNLRMSFPRLYFVSDDELLDLLSVAKDPASIQKHLVK